jgi:hypothetical protein
MSVMTSLARFGDHARQEFIRGGIDVIDSDSRKSLHEGR